MATAMLFLVLFLLFPPQSGSFDTLRALILEYLPESYYTFAYILEYLSKYILLIH